MSQAEETPETPVSFPYPETEPDRSLALRCALYSLLAYRNSRQDESGVWTAAGGGDAEGALADVLAEDGFADLCTLFYDPEGEAVNGAYAQVGAERAGEHTACATLGHRTVRMADGAVRDQIIVVFRGTHEEEWYGNFDITGTAYDETADTHRSFQQAADDTLGYLAAYIADVSDRGGVDASNLTVLLTGHSRGAAVAGLLAHELTDLRDGRADSAAAALLPGCVIHAVHAYTFATPNEAAYDRIQADAPPERGGIYDNIFNYCFTDDFVTNIPLESWRWGKYGKTFWATAAKLDRQYYAPTTLPDGSIAQLLTGGAFHDAAAVYFGKPPVYAASYTDTVVRHLKDLTLRDAEAPLRNYYEKTALLGVSNQSLYFYLRNGMGGAMQPARRSVGAGILLSGFVGAYAPISRNLIVDNQFNAALNDTHQAGSYYAAMLTAFDRFTYAPLYPEGYDATLYGDGEESAGLEGEADAAQLAALRAFLEQKTEILGLPTLFTNAQLLGWDPEDPATWKGVAWNGGAVAGLDVSGTAVSGSLNFSGFASLTDLDVSYNSLT